MKISISTANSNFMFRTGAYGTYYVDWGDGSTSKYTQSDTTATQRKHTYSTIGTYDVKLSGQATKYYNDNISSTTNSTFYVESTSRLIGISGSLGSVFPTVGTGDTNAKQPRFYQSFKGCSSLTGPIPADLFSGVYGTPVQSQFSYLFSGCTSLTGPIPSGLFGGMSGQIAKFTFNRIFENCSSLTGNLPTNMFGNISGTPKQNMFNYAFYNCSSLTGYIPEGFFGNLVATPAATDMLTNVFTGSGLSTTCPDNTEEITLQFTKTQLSGKAACRALNAPCGWTSGLTFSTGQTFSAFTQKTTSAALGLKYNNNVCYIPLSSGIGTAGTLNFSTNNGATTYHATPDE